MEKMKETKMLIVAIAVIFLMAGVFAHYMGKKSYGDWQGFFVIVGFFGYVGALFIFITSVIYTTNQYQDQVFDIESVERDENISALYKEKADTIIKEFDKYLAENYTEHERAIFEALGPEGTMLYLAEYPEIRASETLRDFADKIDELRSDQYQMLVYKEDALRRIRARLRDPWSWPILLPNAPSQ